MKKHSSHAISYCTISTQHTGNATVVLANGAVVTIIVGMITCLFDSILTVRLTQYNHLVRSVCWLIWPSEETFLAHLAGSLPLQTNYILCSISWFLFIKRTLFCSIKICRLVINCKPVIHSSLADIKKTDFHYI